MLFRSCALLSLFVMAGCAGSAPATTGPSASASESSTPAASAPSATPGGSTATQSAPIDLSTVDACALLDEQAVRGLTGTSLNFVTDDSASGPSEAKCFWGSTTPEPPYVEVRIFRRPNLTGYNFQPGSGCLSSPLADVGAEAIGGTCSDPQRKVFLLVAQGGLVVSLLVNEPQRPLTPAELVPTVQSAADQVLG